MLKIKPGSNMNVLARFDEKCIHNKYITGQKNTAIE